MEQTITEQNVADAQRLTMIFATLNEEDKMKAVVYASALRDKEIADSQKTSGK